MIRRWSAWEGLVPLLLLLKFGVGHADTCRDNPYYRHSGIQFRDCEWVGSYHRCGHFENGYHIGQAYCPVTCGYCPQSVFSDSISVSSTCYEFGTEITVTFSNLHPQEDDWVGIYPDSADLNALWSPVLWFWLCGTQGSFCKVLYGTLLFGADPPYEGNWPIAPGTYRAILARNSHSAPYVSYAYSEVFTVKQQGESCNTPPAPMPTHPPVPLPTHPPVPPPTHPPVPPPTHPPVPPPTHPPVPPPTHPPVPPPTHPPVPPPTHPPVPPPTHPPNPPPTHPPAPTPTPAPPTGCHDLIYTNKNCYLKGESIDILFSQCHPNHDDWIGLYYNTEPIQNVGVTHPRMWVYACGNQGCYGSVYTATIRFDGGDPVETGLDSWPLNSWATYQVHLIKRNSYGLYVSVAQSNEFSVVNDLAHCPAIPTSPPQPTPHPPPTPQPHPPPTPQPHPPPTPQPHPPPTPQPHPPPTPQPHPPPTPQPHPPPTPQPHPPPTPQPHPPPTPQPHPAPTPQPHPPPTPQPHPAPTPQPHPVPTCSDYIVTDNICYRKGYDTIVVGFNNCDPQPHDWIGIYDYDAHPSELGWPLFWVWSCGDQHCYTATSACAIAFNAGPPNESSLASWPLYEGRYRAFLVAGVSAYGHYVASAVSDEFVVTDGSCSGQGKGDAGGGGGHRRHRKRGLRGDSPVTAVRRVEKTK